MNDKKGLKSVFDENKYLLLLVPQIFFVYSFVFNYWYFYTFEIKLWNIPITATDYVASLQFLGSVLLPILCSFAPVLVSEFLSKNETKHEDNNPIFIKKLLNITLILGSITSIALVIYVLYSGEIIKHKYAFMTLILPILFFYFKNDGKFYLKSSCLHFFCAFFTCIAYAITAGIDSAEKGYNESKVIFLKKNGDIFYSIRSLSSGNLIKCPESGNILFITSSGDEILFQPPTKLINSLKIEG